MTEAAISVITPRVRAFDALVSTLTMGDDYRIDDDPEALIGLRDSIRKHGVLQPLVVRPRGTGWEVVCGRRRLSAARMAGLDVVPCIVRHLSDAEADDAALAENLHRRRLSPIEEAVAYARLRDREGLSAGAIGARVGRSQPTVSLYLRLLNLPSEIQMAVHAGKMSVQTADRSRHRKPRGTRQGGEDQPRRLSDDAAALISHWRRRHDRLVAGIQAIARTSTGDTQALLKRLLKLDLEPLPER